ncbi:MAG: SUMF1/EgtB/PvdO family nonheme iron enzyme [Prochloraceae cyanobacterium]|nr:SUMF1/EgtB/PvdO family nonheme iron enzyme [Prochloraceae cyanobacterium]
MVSESVKLFISYSHRDEPLRQQLDKHLAPLKGQKVIEAWHDRQIQAGMNWADQIDNNLKQADIILLLVSPDFVVSNYCFNIELKEAMKRHENGEAIVVPVILEPCDWSWLPFSKLQAFPKDAKAIATWENKNEAFLDVAKGIRKVAQDLFKQRQQKLEEKKAAREQYLKKVEEALSDGKISIAERDSLDDLREELKLTQEEAEEIESRAFEPLKKYQDNLKKYEKTFRKYIQSEYPLSDRSKKDLELRQRDLGIKTEDVGQIEQPILAEAEAKYQKKLKQEEAEKKRKQKAEAEQQKQLEQDAQKTAPESKKSPSSLQLFEFEVVTVKIQTKWMGLGSEITLDRRSSKAQYFTENLGNGVTLDMVAIPGGKFLMGTEDEEIERLVKKFNKDWFRFEKPQHYVTVESFFMGKFPVTQAQWKAIANLPKVYLDLAPNPSNFKGDKRPVQMVSWYDAVEFCKRLSIVTGKEYRLPSEAQWEYACRARTTTPFHFGETITSELANYRGSQTYASEPKGEYRQQTTDVGKFSPNAFGLYDMHGNVWEWCTDDWHENYQNAPNDGKPWLSESSSIKVIRGGSWSFNPDFCRSASRYGSTRGYRIHYIGFRVIRVASRTT